MSPPYVLRDAAPAKNSGKRDASPQEHERKLLGGGKGCVGDLCVSGKKHVKLVGVAAYGSRRYPALRTVRMCLGLDGSGSSLRRSSAMWLSTVRVNTSAFP